MAHKIKTGFFRPHERKAFQTTNEVLDPRTGELVELPSMTKQSFVEQCDINNILKQYKVSGMLQHVSSKAAQGSYEDLPDEIDFQTSLNIVKEAETAFASLPSKLRNRFENDPAQFLEFMSDPNNLAEAQQLGLVKPPPPPEEPPPAPPGPPEPPPA